METLKSTNKVGNAKQKFAWAFYDWANSVYSLVITTAIFPLYFGAIIKNKTVQLFGINFSDKDILYSYSISVSFMLVVILSPILSAMADSIGNKKLFLKIFSWLGALGCASLFFFVDENTLWIGILGSILASVGYWASLVFYNAYLPEIASKDEQDQLSARGFIYGYLGSAILLIICLVMIFTLGEEYTKFSFLLVAFWWVLFAQYTFANLPESFTQPIKKSKTDLLFNAHKELAKVGRDLFNYDRLKYFLMAFFMLSLGIQTISYMATRFGDKELGLPANKLIITVLLIQFVAILGSWLFSLLSTKFGNKLALQIGLFGWALICVSAFFMNKNNPNVDLQFYLLGAAVGLVLGGVQALARSSYSKLLPKTNDNTIYFSFYDIVEKIALILGGVIFAWVLYLTGSMQYSALILGIFFVFAILLLIPIKNPK